MDTKGEKMRARDFSPEGRAEQTLKDVHMMLAEGERLGQPLPMAQLHAQILQACIDSGEGTQDSSVVVEELRRRGAAQP
jgi:3-hydroxyisobutyrate dehydrogenase-like beta-hydroxyacid dehydrogenase